MTSEVTSLTHIISCREVKRISAYLDGELDSASSRRMERHFSECAACQGIIADFQRVDLMIRGLQRPPINPRLVKVLLEKVAEQGTATTRVESNMRPVAWFHRFIANLVDLLEERTSPGTASLDEFEDFPPCSIGSVYLKLIKHPM